jgi:hypothetical protein
MNNINVESRLVANFTILTLLFTIIAKNRMTVISQRILSIMMNFLWVHPKIGVGQE